MADTGLFNQTPNFGPYIGTPVVVKNDSYPDQREFTELAESMIPVVGQTPLTELFPEETIPERTVRVIQRYEGLITTFPVVQMGMPDVVLDDEGGIKIERTYDPIFIRRSGYFNYGEINNLVRPGTDNEPYSPAQHIADKMEKLVISHNTTWDVWRALMLLGGINYRDPRTNYSVNVSASIPAYNIIHYANSRGYKGRNESSIFRTLTEENQVETLLTAIPWTHPDAAIVHAVRRLKRFFKKTNKSELTAMYMSAELREIVVENNEIKAALNGIVPMRNPNQTVTDSRYYNSSQGGNLLTGAIQLDSNGELAAIAGVEVRVVETEFKDPQTGANRTIWPMNKVVFVSEVNSSGVREAVGRTQFCASEESGGKPGVWVRIQTETQIPAAPGMYIQMGNAGMPYLKYPHRVLHLTVCEVADIKKRLGLLADTGHGYF